MSKEEAKKKMLQAIEKTDFMPSAKAFRDLLRMLASDYDERFAYVRGDIGGAWRDKVSEEDQEIIDENDLEDVEKIEDAIWEAFKNLSENPLRNLGLV